MKILKTPVGFGGVLVPKSFLVMPKPAMPQVIFGLDFFGPKRWHPARGRFGDGLRLADITLRQHTYDGEKLPVEEMSEIWKPTKNRQLSKANKPTDVNCTGICVVHLIVAFLDIV